MGTILAKAANRYNLRWPIVSAHELPPIWIAIAFLLVIVVGVSGKIIGCDVKLLGSTFSYIALVWACGVGVGMIGAKLLGGCMRLVAVFMLLALATPWASDVLAVNGLPYADDMLATLDAWLFGGFDWPTMIEVVRPHTKALLLLSYAYASLNWQPLILLALLCCAGKMVFAWRFLTAWAIALGFCLLVFPFCPAVGGYSHFHIGPETIPGVRVMSAWEYPVLLGKLRDGSVHVLDLSNLAGIIAMPSFHAASSVLLAWGYGRLRWLYWPFLALNAAMLVSAVPIGGHYLIDVLAGALVAGLSIIIANRWVDAGSRESEPHPSRASAIA
ncbi:MAG: phosphatase PAP2 family protein [Sphingomonas bacterium]